MRKFLLLDGLFQSGRSFFGAISAAYLLSRGVALGDLAMLKIIQSLVGIAFEVPTGLLADAFGRRSSLMISLVLGCASFLTFALSVSFWHFAAAEILLALCLTFWSGAYDAFSIESLQIGDNASELNRFYHSRNVVCAVLTIASGFLGGVLAIQGLNLPYIASFIAFALIAVWVAACFPSDSDHSAPVPRLKTSFEEIARATWAACLTPTVLPLLLGFALMEIVLQPLIYYWQPLLELLAPDYAALKLGSVYAIFQMAIIGTGLLFAWLSTHNGAKSHATWIIVWICFSTCMLLIGSGRGFMSSVLLLTLAEVFFTFGESTMKAVFNQRVAPRYRASCLSILGFAVRLGSLVSLVAIRTHLNGRGQSIEALQEVFSGAGWLGLSFCLLLAVIIVVFCSVQSGEMAFEKGVQL